MSRRLNRRKPNVLSDISGVAAVEFAFVAPLLALLLMGTVDVSSAVTAGNRATFVAETVAQLVSQTKITLTEDDLTQIMQSAPLVDPDILRYARAANVPILNAVSVTVTSFAFTLADPSCKTDCKYDANVVFSRSLSGTPQPCGKISSSSSAASILPSEVYSANSIVSVNITTRFKPIFSRFIIGELTFKRSAYFRPRYVEPVKLPTNCAGYT